MTKFKVVMTIHYLQKCVYIATLDIIIIIITGIISHKTNLCPDSVDLYLEHSNLLSFLVAGALLL